jgi:Gpi18-like mannosyltransferase
MKARLNQWKLLVVDRSKKILLSPYFSIGLVLLSLYIRYRGIQYVSYDMAGYLLKWYQGIAKNGLLEALRGHLGNYTPPYFYLLDLATLTRPVFEPIVAIKLISLIFDIFSAWMVFRIIKIKYANIRVSFFAASLFFLLPTVLLNSGFWGQADSIFTGFLLACLYFLILDRPGWSIFFFAVAFSFKLQSIFLLPFLLALTLRRKIPWISYILVPLVYMVLVLPDVLAGSSWDWVLTIYLKQAHFNRQWSLNAANPYGLISPATNRIQIFSHTLSFPYSDIYAALLAAAILASLWILATSITINPQNKQNLLLGALASVCLMPYILPRMHDRYFYPADVISLLVAFYTPRLWFMPILFQISSSLVYANILLLKVYPLNLPIAIGVNTLALIAILGNQFSVHRGVPKAAE